MEVPSDLGSLEKIQADLQKLEDPLMVAVVGCFSAGKSTLINALVGAKVCKTGKLPVTMKLSHIPYQNGERIELVDTMGVDAMDFPKHKEETADAIANADAVIYAVNANNLGTISDGFIGDTLRAYKTPGIVVVTHWDQVEEDEDQEAVRQDAQKMANDIFPQQDQRPVFFINAKIAESQNALKQAVVPPNNGDFAKLEQCIQTKLADKDNKQRMKLSNVLHNLLSVCQKKVDLLSQRSKELGQKNWASEYEQIEEDYKKESVEKQIRLRDQVLVSAQKRLTALQKQRDSAIEKLERIVQDLLDQKQEEEKEWNSKVENQEEEVKGHEEGLQKLEAQEKQLKKKTDKAKAKVAEQQEEAEEVRDRCQMLIRRLEQHQHTIHVHLKDHKCLWGQFSQSSRKTYHSVDFLIGCI